MEKASSTTQGAPASRIPPHTPSLQRVLATEAMHNDPPRAKFSHGDIVVRTFSTERTPNQLVTTVVRSRFNGPTQEWWYDLASPLFSGTLTDNPERTLDAIKITIGNQNLMSTCAGDVKRLEPGWMVVGEVNGIVISNTQKPEAGIFRMEFFKPYFLMSDQERKEYDENHEEPRFERSTSPESNSQG
jgi:hypothetical protein